MFVTEFNSKINMHSLVLLWNRSSQNTAIFLAFCLAMIVRSFGVLIPRVLLTLTIVSLFLK